MATTRTLIGPIRLVASADGPQEDLDNHFGNILPKPVGGVVMPVNKLEVLAPCLALAGSVTVVSTAVLVRKRSKA